jgi:hypothetical protein
MMEDRRKNFLSSVCFLTKNKKIHSKKMINATGATPSTFTPQQPPQAAPVAPPPAANQEPAPNMQASNSTPPKSKGKNSSKLVFGGLFLALLVVGALSVFWLVGQNQDVRNRAAVDPGDGGGYGPTATPIPAPTSSGSGICGPGAVGWNSGSRTCTFF